MSQAIDVAGLRTIAAGAVTAADAFLAAAKDAPTADEVARDIAQKDSALGASLRGSVGAGFVQSSSPGASGDVANVRLVEPAGFGAKGVAVLRQGMYDALGALEDRQRSDDVVYGKVSASSSALLRKASAVMT